MFYRRKILLALLEAFGGFLSKTDCQKMLLLFCVRRGVTYYDFFPHKYGNFSLILSQDRDRLANLGFLTSHSDFQLKGKQSYVDQIAEKDRGTLQAFVSEIGNLRGEGLIRKVYLEAPHYVCRSQIAANILASPEYEQVSRAWNSATSPCLFTLGYEGMTIDAYLDVLVSNNIAVLVDVRKNPISRKYGFSKTKLSASTRIAGITYIHVPDLGISSHLRQELESEAAYQRLFAYYSTQILPGQKEAIERVKGLVRDHGRVALMCFEADHRFCHRHKVTEYLENEPDFAFPIVHLDNNSRYSANFSSTTRSYGLWDENGVYSSL